MRGFQLSRFTSKPGNAQQWPCKYVLICEQVMPGRELKLSVVFAFNPVVANKQAVASRKNFCFIFVSFRVRCNCLARWWGNHRVVRRRENSVLKGVRNRKKPTSGIYIAIGCSYIYIIRFTAGWGVWKLSRMRLETVLRVTELSEDVWGCHKPNSNFSFMQVPPPTFFG